MAMSAGKLRMAIDYRGLNRLVQVSNVLFPAVLTANINPQRGMANGSQVIFHSITFPPDCQQTTRRMLKSFN